MNILKILLLAFAALLAGCAGDGDVRRDIAVGNLRIATEYNQRETRPLLDASIPIPGCTPTAGSSCVMVIRVENPMVRPAPQVAMPDNATARVWEKAIDQTGTLLNIAAGGAAANALVRSTSRGIVSALKVQPAPVVVEKQTVVPAQVVNPVIVETPAAQVVDPVVVQVPTQVVEPAVVNPVVVNPVIVTADP